MATIADLLVKISADTSQFRKELEASQRQLNRTFGSEAMGLSRRFAQGIMAVGAGLTAIGAASIKMAGDMRVTERSFTHLIGNAEEAKEKLEELKVFTQKTPFGFKDVTDSSKKLLAYGFKAKDLIPVLTAAGEASSTFGNGADGVDRITLALGQMLQKGKIVTEEMKQLMNANVNGWKYLADEMGVSIEEVQKMASKGQIPAAQGINAIVRGMQEEFGGAMDIIAQELPGQWSKIKNNTQMALIEIGTSISEALDIKGKMQAAVEWTDRFTKSLREGGLGAAFLASTSEESRVNILLLAGAITGATIPALNAMRLAAIKAMAPLLPLMAIGAAIAGSIYLVHQAYKVVEKDVIAFDKTANETWLFFGQSAMIGGAKLTNAADEARAAVLRLNQSLLDTANIMSGVKGAMSGAVGMAAAGTFDFAPAIKAAKLTPIEGDDKDKRKKGKSLADQVKDALDAVKQLDSSWRMLITDINRGGLTGAALFEFDQQNDLDNAISKLKADFDDLTERFNSSTEKQKEIYRKWLDEQGIMYAESQQGLLDLTAERVLRETQLEQNAQAQRQRDYAANKDILAEIDAARYEGDMARLMEYLNAEAAARLVHLESMQSLMDLYLETRKASMMDEYAFMNEVYGEFYSGFSSTLSDIVMQTQSASEAFKALGKNMLKVVIDFLAKKLAGMITSTMMAITLGKKQTAASVGDAAVTAAAWAKAAAMVAIATRGAAVASAMVGIAATVSLADGLAMVPMATGGIATGPTPALIGEGRYNEAVLPLNENYLRRVGLIQDESQAVNVVQNNYGDINTDVDFEDMQEALGYALQNALKVA